MNYEEYCELYKKVLCKTQDKEAAIAILQEIGKDSRTPRDHKDTLATEPQKKLMRSLKIEFGDSITKTDASKLIDKKVK